jgi:HTH-type transcriptional regulator, cell division transcriptional repressor
VSPSHFLEIKLMTETPTTDSDDSSSMLGLRLRNAREELGLSSAQLARRIGVEKQSLDAWEAGERPPRANRLVMLSGMLGVSLLCGVAPIPWTPDPMRVMQT